METATPLPHYTVTSQKRGVRPWCRLNSSRSGGSPRKVAARPASSPTSRGPGLLRSMRRTGRRKRGAGARTRSYSPATSSGPGGGPWISCAGSRWGSYITVAATPRSPSGTEDHTAQGGGRTDHGDASPPLTNAAANGYPRCGQNRPPRLLHSDDASRSAAAAVAPRQGRPPVPPPVWSSAL